MHIESTQDTITLFDLPLLDATQKETALRLLDGTKRRLAFINADCINKRATDPAYARALDNMDLLLPDGSGLALAAMLRGTRFKANLNGTDLFPLVCEQAQRTGRSIFLLGGKPGVADEAAERLRTAFPSLRIAGTRHGYFEPSREADIVAAINASGADILCVAMGAPLQEIFIDRHAGALSPSLCMGVGGLLDFIAGRVPRAPKPLRAVGMEWAWRLACEPSRMAKRYLLGNPLFIARALSDAVNVERLAKRAVDVTLSGMALLLLLPVFALIAVFIRLDSSGGVFFVQTRVGEGGKPFRMIKFRTMHKDAEARRQEVLSRQERVGPCFKMAHDPRMTRVGRWLRRNSLDELPQLLNVLRGNMSLVGPRPALPCEVAEYDAVAMERIAGMPGITCLWQIAGRADLSFQKQVELDIAYLRARSVLLDLLIIILTPIAMVTRRGAY